MEQLVAQEPPRRGRPPVSGLADRRRQQIVDAAFAAFTENGYEQTSMSDIATRAGMGQGTVYRYVESKREVLDLVFDYGVERLVDTLALDDFLEVVGGTAGIEERNDIIMEGGRRLYALVDQEPALLKLLTVQSAAADKELKQRVLGIQSMLDSYVQRGLESGRRGRLATGGRTQPGGAGASAAGTGLARLSARPKPTRQSQYPRAFRHHCVADRGEGNPA